MADWVREHLKSIEIDDDLIEEFVTKGIRSKRRFLKLNETRLNKYFPDLCVADVDDILDSINLLKADEPLFSRTISNSSVQSSTSLKMENLKRDDSLKESNTKGETSTDKDDTILKDKIPLDKVLMAALDRADKYEDDPKVEYYDIFISYRRSRHTKQARTYSISKQVLKEKGMKVFLDIDREGGLGVGMFQDQLEKVLHKVPIVIVMMTKAPSGPNDEERGGINRSVLSSMEHVSKYAHLGWTDYCRIEMAVALRMKKLVVPVYPGSEGSSYVGKELSKLQGIEDVQSLRNCNAFPIHDDMFDQSVGIIVDKIQQAIKPPALPSLASTLSQSKIPASALDALKEGCTVLQCKLFGFTAMECKLAGYKASELYPLCIEPKGFYNEKAEIVARNQKCIKDIAGWSDVDIHIGYFFGRIDVPTTRYGTHRAIMSESCNSSAQEFLVRAQDKEGSHPFGFGPDRLLKFDYTRKEIETLNLTATRLRNMGYNARECKNMGFSALDCRLAGFSAKKLYDLCIQPKAFDDFKSGTELICRNQERQQQANTEEEVGIFISRLVEARGQTHKISKVRGYWPNDSRMRSQSDKGFFPFGFGPDRILKFASS